MLELCTGKLVRTVRRGVALSNGGLLYRYENVCGAHGNSEGSRYVVDKGAL